MSQNAAQLDKGLRKGRNPFPEEHFFSMPLKLYQSGLAAHMSGSEFKRYCTLLRLSNYNYGAAEVEMDQQQLAKLDGVSARTGFTVHTRLEEYGLISVDRQSKPFTYRLISPSVWPDQTFKRHKLKRRGRVQVETKYSPVRWN